MQWMYREIICEALREEIDIALSINKQVFKCLITDQTPDLEHLKAERD